MNTFFPRILCLGLILFCFQNLLAAPFFASKELKIQADDARISTNDDGHKTLTLNGSVEVIFKSHLVRSQVAIIHLNEKTIEAKGDVYIETQETKANCDRATLHYEKNTGVLHSGVVRAGQVKFEGKIIYKTGPENYEAIDGSYTACTTCPPSWSFQGTKVKAEVGGYARIRNSVMKVTYFPVFWLPYLVVPLKSDRQTGFLFPTFEWRGDYGFTFSQKFFWAMTPSQDSTWTLRNYAAGGLKGLVNYRYVLTKKSRGEFDFGFIRDKLFPGTTRMKSVKHDGSVIPRWFGRYWHHYDLPDNYVHRADLNLASDVQYPQDFTEELPGYGDPALENRMSLRRNSEFFHSSLDTAIYINMLKKDPRSANIQAVHRFPEVRFSMVPRRFTSSNLLFSFEAQYNNFAREDYAYDDIDTSNGYAQIPTLPSGELDRDGKFDSGTDLIRTGQRLDLIPKLAYPFHLGRYIDILPSIAYRETHYKFSVDENASAERRLVRFNTSARTKFSRVYGKKSEKANRYKHEIQPELTYSNIPWLAAQSHPFFGPENVEPFFRANQPVIDSDQIQFDYNDRLIKRNIITMALTNRLIRKSWSQSAPTYKQIALLKLAQSYDFYEVIRQTDEAKQPWSDISLLLDVRLDRFETNSLIRYYPYQNVSSVSSRMKVMSKRGEYAQLNYTQDFTLENGRTVILSSRTEDVGLSLGLIYKYFDLSGGVTYSRIESKIKEYNYAAKIKPPGNCWHIAWTHKQIPDTKPVVTVSVAFMFDGKTPTSVGNETLRRQF
jgi:LPS-assembly protein